MYVNRIISDLHHTFFFWFGQIYLQVYISFIDLLQSVIERKTMVYYSLLAYSWMVLLCLIKIHTSNRCIVWRRDVSRLYPWNRHSQSCRDGMVLRRNWLARPRLLKPTAVPLAVIQCSGVRWNPVTCKVSIFLIIFLKLNLFSLHFQKTEFIQSSFRNSYLFNLHLRHSWNLRSQFCLVPNFIIFKWKFTLIFF